MKNDVGYNIAVHLSTFPPLLHHKQPGKNIITDNRLPHLVDKGHPFCRDVFTYCIHIRQYILLTLLQQFFGCQRVFDVLYKQIPLLPKTIHIV